MCDVVIFCCYGVGVMGGRFAIAVTMGLAMGTLSRSLSIRLISVDRSLDPPYTTVEVAIRRSLLQ